MTRQLAPVWVLLISLITLPAIAGSQAGGGELGVEQAARAGKQLERVLAAHGARVAIVARVGHPRDQLPEGIRYTHVAYAIYSQVQLADGRQVPGYTFYNLYQQPERLERSDLVVDYATDFFMGAVMTETAVLIPTPAVQRRLQRVMLSADYAQLHQPRYSVIANPYDLTHQNCTEFVLDVLQTALYGVQRPAQRKANLQAYFVAQPVKVSPLKLLVGSLAAPEVTVADHAGKPVQTATFGSLSRYMSRYQLLNEGFEVLDNGQVRPLAF